MQKLLDHMKNIVQDEKILLEQADFDLFYESYDYSEIRKVMATYSTSIGLRSLEKYLILANTLNVLHQARFGLYSDIKSLLEDFDYE
jgi:hypothetical protein